MTSPFSNPPTSDQQGEHRANAKDTDITVLVLYTQGPSVLKTDKNHTCRKLLWLNRLSTGLSFKRLGLICCLEHIALFNYTKLSYCFNCILFSVQSGLGNKSTWLGLGK